MTDNQMGKEERKRAILRLLADSELALPPKVTYTNLRLGGATFSNRTVLRLLQEMANDGLVEKVEDTNGYYRITDAGRDYLET